MIFERKKMAEMKRIRTVSEAGEVNQMLQKLSEAQESP